MQYKHRSQMKSAFTIKQHPFSIIVKNICFFFVILILTITSATSAFAANPLGFEIGKARYDDIKSELSPLTNLKHQGINRFSGGKMLVADKPESLGYDGLKKVTLIFDHKNILTAVVMRLKRDENGKRNAGFMYVYKKLDAKYFSDFQNIKPMGRMTAGFTARTQDNDKQIDVHIRMMSERASDVFDLQYLSEEFWQRYDSAKAKPENLRYSAQYKNLIKNNVF